MFPDGTILSGDCATCGDNKGPTVVTRVAMANMAKINNAIPKAGASAVELSEALNEFSVAVAVEQPAPVGQPKPKESPLAAAKERIEKNV